MSNEFKLITALCDALGFEVETHLDYDERSEVIGNMDGWRARCGKERNLICSAGQLLKIDNDGHYTSRLNIPIASYTLNAKV